MQTSPCDDHTCGWGKECVVDKQGEPICECISKCPLLDNDNDPLDQVLVKFILKLKFLQLGLILYNIVILIY